MISVMNCAPTTTSRLDTAPVTDDSETSPVDADETKSKDLPSEATSKRRVTPTEIAPMITWMISEKPTTGRGLRRSTRKAAPRIVPSVIGAIATRPGFGGGVQPGGCAPYGGGGGGGGGGVPKLPGGGGGGGACPLPPAGSGPLGD